MRAKGTNVSWTLPASCLGVEGDSTSSPWRAGVWEGQVDGADTAGCLSPVLALGISAFLSAPWHASMPVLAFILLRPHREKAAVFQNEVWCDCSCILHPVFWPFLHSCFLHPANHGRIEVPQGGHPSWGSHSKLVKSSEKASFLLFWQQGGRKQSPTTGRLALQLWQSSDGPFCRSSHPLSSCLICLHPTMTAGENGWDQEGKHPNLSWHSSFRLGRTTVKGAAFLHSMPLKGWDWQQDSVLSVFLSEEPCLLCHQSLSKGPLSEEAQCYKNSTLVSGWKEKQAMVLSPFPFFFLKIPEIKKTTHIFTQQ